MANLKAQIHDFREKAVRIAEHAAPKKKCCFLSVDKLPLVKRIALRRHVWFRALNPLERGILDITMKYVDNVKSSKLANILTAIIEKLQQAMESMIDKLARTIGVSLAQKISCIATKWGNKSAHDWASDLSFAAFLAVMHRNG